MQAGCGLGGQKRLPTQLLQAGQAGEDKSLAGLGEGWEEETLPWTAPPPIQVLMSSSPGAGREDGGGRRLAGDRSVHLVLRAMPQAHPGTPSKVGWCFTPQRLDLRSPKAAYPSINPAGPKPPHFVCWSSCLRARERFPSDSTWARQFLP